MVRSAPPWQAAEQAADWMRIGLGIGRGPLRNKRLAELLGTRKEAFDLPRPSVETRPYGLRLKDESGSRDRIVLRSRWPQARRFEMARALGDAIWADHDRLGPLASSNTSRQKFQRAFAQSLLCPFDDLMAYMGAERPGASDVEAAARHFHVSEQVVRTVLVNKGVLGQANLSGQEQVSTLPHQFAEAIDGA
jgi:Zn-dependent peptidase ImmA (M78 family)